MPPGTKNQGEINGWDNSWNADLDETKTLVSDDPCRLGGWFIHNPDSVTNWLQIFDVNDTDDAILGTTKPKMSLAIPAGASANVEMTNGIDMDNGIVIAVTNSNEGNGAPAAGMDSNILFR